MSSLRDTAYAIRRLTIAFNYFRVRNTYVTANKLPQGLPAQRVFQRPRPHDRWLYMPIIGSMPYATPVPAPPHIACHFLSGFFPLLLTMSMIYLGAYAFSRRALICYIWHWELISRPTAHHICRRFDGHGHILIEERRSWKWARILALLRWYVKALLPSPALFPVPQPPHFSFFEWSRHDTPGMLVSPLLRCNISCSTE